MIQVDDVERFLAGMEWDHSRFEDTNTWLVALEHMAEPFYLTVELHKDWLAFTVNPLIEKPKADCLARLSYHLCRLNRDIVMAKLFIDEEADVGLAVELPRHDLQEAGFRKAIKIVVHYLTKEFEELQRLGQDPEAPSRYLHGSE